MKIRVPKKTGGETEKTTGVKAVDRYTPFGDMAETFKGQGWIPERWNDEVTEYKSGYGLLNSVELPSGKGYISIRGGNTNGVFDILIKDAKGNVVQPILRGANVRQVNDYFTNYNAQNNYGGQMGSVINQRANQIQANPNLQNTMAFKK